MIMRSYTGQMHSLVFFEERFVAANIPYKIVGGINFCARQEIKDLLAYLKTIDNGQDDLAVRRIINVPKRGIGLTTINRVQESAAREESDFYEALQGLDLIPNICQRAAKWILLWRLSNTSRGGHRRRAYPI